MVDSTIKSGSRITEKKSVIISSKDVPIYKIASRQSNMQSGKIIAGHTYPYNGKTQNAEGIFYNIGKGFVYADNCITIQ